MTKKEEALRGISENLVALSKAITEFMEIQPEEEVAKAMKHQLYKILYRQPNPEMTSFSFREVMMTHLLLWGMHMRR